jgi:hypothetical protein
MWTRSGRGGRGGEGGIGGKGMGRMGRRIFEDGEKLRESGRNEEKG